jgi:hypothetical protein
MIPVMTLYPDAMSATAVAARVSPDTLRTVDSFVQQQRSEHDRQRWVSALDSYCCVVIFGPPPMNRFRKASMRSNA